MNIPRQLMGMNYLTKIKDNFQDGNVLSCPKTEYHQIQDGSNQPLESGTSLQLALNAGKTLEFLKSIMTDPLCALDGIAIARGERKVCMGYRPPYSERNPRITNSTCKTITAIAVMFAISEHLLTKDDPVLSFFPEYDNLLTPKYTRRLTLYHLLTMTSCSKCNEIASVTEQDWVKAFLLSDCQYEPGSRFIYNSMNTYMLAAILTKVTGCSLVDYLKDRLFTPLGIHQVEWEVCPLGIERGGWGLHFSLESMLKIGMFLANDGAYGGRQLIRPTFIREMKRTNVEQNADALATGYGYQIWHLPRHLTMLSGMFGQHVIFDEKKHLVVAMNAHNDKMFPDSVLVRKVIHYMTDDAIYHVDNIWKEQNNYRCLMQYMKAFQKGYSMKEYSTRQPYLLYCREQEREHRMREQQVMELCNVFDRKRLHVNGATFKLFPYMLQGMYQYPPFHVSDMIFRKKEKGLVVTFYRERSRKEGWRDQIEMRAGADIFCYQTLSIGSDTKEIAVRIMPATDEEEHAVILLDIIFPGEGISRRIKFFLLEDRIAIECMESPDMRAIVEQVLSGDAVIAGNTYDIADKLPESLRVFLEHKVEPKVYAEWKSIAKEQKNQDIV